MAYRVSLDGGASWAYCDGDGCKVLQNGDVESYEVHNAAGMRPLNPSISPVVPTLDGLNGDEIVITEIMMVQIRGQQRGPVIGLKFVIHQIYTST